MRNIEVTLLAMAALVLAALPAVAAPTTETAGTDVMELKWLGPYYLDSEPQPPEGNMMQQLIEERFNVKIEIANISSADNEKLPLWFAEGNTADYVSVKLAFGQSLVDQGLLRSYPKEWLWEHAPEWADRMEAMFGDRLEREMTYKGEAWALPYNNWAEVESSYLPLVRKDWMDNLNITEDPVTIDEHFELLKQFTYGDPDGDGKDDTYGMSHISFVYGLGFSWVFAAYGYQDKSFYVKDGQVIYTNSQDEYKQALKTLAEWYEAGVIDPTFATNKGGEFYDGWGMGDFGLNWQPPVALTAARAQIGLDLGFRGMKMKCALGDPIAERVAAVREVAPHFPIVLDPNERFHHPEGTREVSRSLDGLDRVTFESPMPQDRLDWYAEVRGTIPQPVALHLTSITDLLPAVRAEAADCYNLLGPLKEFVEWATLTRKAGLPTWRGTGVDLGVRDMSSVHAAAATGCELPCDIIGSLLREDDLIVDPIPFEDGLLVVPDAPGLGVELDRDALAHYGVPIERAA